MTDKYIIQRLNDLNQYEDFSGYCEHPLNYDEMLAALEQCDNKYSVYEFRGHNITNCKCHDKE